MIKPVPPEDDLSLFLDDAKPFIKPKAGDVEAERRHQEEIDRRGKKIQKEMQEVRDKYFKYITEEELQAMTRVYQHATPIEVIQVTLLSRIAVALEELVKQGNTNDGR
jgi:hypothetical protein